MCHSRATHYTGVAGESCVASNTGVTCMTCVNVVATEVGVFNKPGREWNDRRDTCISRDRHQSNTQIGLCIVCRVHRGKLLKNDFTLTRLISQQIFLQYFQTTC